MPQPTHVEKRLSSILAQYQTHRRRYIDAFRNLLLLKYYLDQKGISFFFGFWNRDPFIDEFFGLPSDKDEVMRECCPPALLENYVEGSFDYDDHPDINSLTPARVIFPQTIARDYAHAGPNSHYNYANLFHHSIKRRDGYVSWLNNISIKKDR